ncbi:methyltransferas-like protein [Dothidotthia symphoricarpi CBS 119687]|uniref:carnosine N-methyltransferase n=1 Tax=Dothidotthia symphoricarpi CBS 119687 TaxID=1392245 RepID=A0A6A6A254_9PLEO|nr:methyltransferas-like protein [Dothidotthia symphoricarpi CBS 119687]KAF2124661.1 methyltransferas-like protein [Dothidotthia symphoricarpi CBS 119687]
MPEKEWEGDFDPMADPEEQQHLLSVLDSFRSYRRLAHFNGTHVRRQAFYSLPQEHWTLLSQPPFSLLASFNKLDDLIDSNAELAEAIFTAGFKAFLAPTIDSEWVASIIPAKHAGDEYQICSTVMDHMSVQTNQTDMEKARSCINQFYREWSAEGALERAKCFDPVVAALHDEHTRRLTTTPGLDRSDTRVLVPGAGLGRLVFDVCRAGYSVEGNEISYHELMASALVLNHTQRVGQFSIAPFALNGSNHHSRAEQMQAFAVPDVHPGTELADRGKDKVPAHERMSMATGDFCVLYSQLEYAGVFDAVATVFFIDTAPNVIRYVEAVRNCLKAGGVWINLGPLLWHHASRGGGEEDDEQKRKKRSQVADAGIGDPGSVELTNDEVVALVEHLGFVMEKQESGTFETGYISNPKSMQQSTYRPVFWIARKK